LAARSRMSVLSAGIFSWRHGSTLVDGHYFNFFVNNPSTRISENRNNRFFKLQQLMEADDIRQIKQITKTWNKLTLCSSQLGTEDPKMSRST